MRYEYIRSMKLAGHLMMQGFKIYSVQKDIKNPAFDVYVFKKSGKLCAAIQDYSNSENGGNYGIINKGSNSKTIRENNTIL